MNTQSLMIGLVLVLGSLAIIGGLAVHPPGEGADNTANMQLVVDEEAMWRTSHWLFGFGFALVAAAGVAMVFTNTGLGRDGIARVGWAITAVFSPLAMLAILSEATILADIAVAGNQEMFNYWYDGVTIGLFTAAGPAVFIGWALVAFSQARGTERVMPAWSGWVAFAGAVLALGAPLGLLLENEAITMMFFAVLVPNLWFIWYGVRILMGHAEGASAPRARSKKAKTAA